MHVSFMVPLWALAGFGFVAYPSIGIMIGRYLLRVSQRRLPMPVVAVASTLWPVTVALGVGALPLWFLGWTVANYHASVQKLMSTRKPAGQQQAGKFMIGSKVSVRGHICQDGREINNGWLARVIDHNGQMYKLDFDACGGGGIHWIEESYIG